MNKEFLKYFLNGNNGPINAMSLTNDLCNIANDTSF